MSSSLDNIMFEGTFEVNSNSSLDPTMCIELLGSEPVMPLIRPTIVLCYLDSVLFRMSS